MFLRKLSDWFIKISVGWLAFLFFVIFVIFNMTAVMRQYEILKEYRGNAGAIDMSLFYNADDVFQMAEEYGEFGRESYIHQVLTFDVVYPVLLVSFLVTSISYLVGKLLRHGNKWRLVNLLPIPGFFFDYLENSFAIMIMRVYPQKLTILASIVPYLSFFKWFFIAVCLTTIFILLGMMIWRSINAEKTKKT